MSFLDQLSSATVGTINSTIGQSRANVGRSLESFVSKALPNTNRIPGPLGGFVESQKRNLTNMVGDGVKQVFNVINVPVDTLVKQASTKIYENGVNAAKNMWADIKGGQKSVSSIVSSAREPLALLQYTHNTLPVGSYSVESLHDSTRTSPYAMDLFRLAPKHKFLFVVEFIFNGGYDFIGQGQRSKNDFAVTIKDFDRPKVKYDYEEHVNFYNFRTPVIKRVVHEPLTIKFLDDRQNLSMNFFQKYMAATHPLSNVGVESAALYESNGMNFTSALNTSSTSVLNENLLTILKEIKVYHLYDFGSVMNVHHFISIEHDNWNMADSEGSSIQAQFAYDNWTVETGVKVDASKAAVIGTLSNSGTYQLHPIQVAANSQGMPDIANNVGTDEASIQSALKSGTQLAIEPIPNTTA
jgi:hypothetical protein